VRLLLALLAVATLAGCGPIRSQSALTDAEVALEAARAAGASQSATLEYVSAEAYLHKARESANRARYEAATTFAAKAVTLAKDAREKALASSNRPESP
jgi:uncharacterized protein YceK